MRTTSLFLTLAYAASMVMARPTIRAEPVAEVAETHTSYSSCNRPGVFALTFDDGPDKYSWGLAKTLHDQGIKATFFINGANSVNVLEESTTTEEGEKTYLEVIKQYYDQGHEIASHTYEHKDLKGLTVEEVEYQMNTQSDVIFKAIGKRPALMRPPEGVTDDVSAKVLKDLGYHNILWDIDTNDWRHLGLSTEQKNVKEVLDEDIANVTMGHISLEHDIHEDTVNTLVPWLTEYVKSKGLTFVTVSDCIGVEPYQPDASTGASNTTTTPATVDAALTADINLSTIDIDLTNL
ncbi:uncharacterized protein EV154DRAFT_584934 [Mucor mucedo]|uniref:uncharacterized protein n=1 Tax=Mucor mucedo TaxID=29922 RepID=UPI00221F0A0C|nr:uncharacterized protein EV154DRAFT_584934 [Mucor mucedo]KAI7896766.1 hypothetical protein EV154DRAFT_584934 [Mucor mucedo]